MHHVDLNRLRDAFDALKRDAAPGVDGLTWRDYEADLDSKLADLMHRVHKGGPYHPLPARRRFIPKADGNPRVTARGAPGGRRRGRQNRPKGDAGGAERD